MPRQSPGRAGVGISGHKGADVGGYIDGIGTKEVEGHDLERALAGTGEDDRGRHSRLVRLQPAACHGAPPIPRLQSREAELGPRRAQIVANLFLMGQELRASNHADGVAPQVIGTTPA